MHSLQLRTTFICSAILLLFAALLLSGCSLDKKFDTSGGPGEKQLTLIGQDASSVRWSPDGSKLAVVTTGGYLAIYEAKAGTFQLSRYADKKTGYINGRSLAWGADGNKIYYYDRPIDEKSQEPAPLEYGSLLMSADMTAGTVTNVHPQFIESVVSMDAAPDGSQLYMSMHERRKYSIVSFQLREGLHHDLTAKLAVEPAGGTRLSRDGKRLFVNERLAEGERSQAVIIELATGHRQIISDQYLANAAFSPDGRWLAYAGTDHMVSVIPTDQQADAEPIMQSGLEVGSLDWAPDGARIALTAQGSDGSRSAQLYLLEVPQHYRTYDKS